MRRIATLALALAACTDTTSNPPTQLNLDRPVDVSFACYGGLRLTGGNAADPSQEVTSTAQPLESCNVRSQRIDDEPQVPPGQEDLTGQGGTPVGNANYIAFILQSGPGTVAVARFETKPSTSFTGGYAADVTIDDADTLTPGKNSITVGEDPVAIVTDRVGCYEVVANAGSCDLSVLDINSVFQSTAPGEDAVVNQLIVRNASGQRINARPAAMVAEPPGGTIGLACPAQPSGLVYIAYPSCHLVAGVDVSTGTIVTGVQWDANGVPQVVDGNVTCPSECDGGGAVTAGVRPVALDLEVETRGGSTRRVLAIGADNSNILTVYDLDAAYRPFTATQVPLVNTTGRLGVTSLAVSPRIGMGGSTGAINDGLSAFDHQFIYAVANDGSVRVVDIQNVARECDTQVDPRFIREIRSVDQLACFAVGATSTPPRRAGARGPGIELVGDAVPMSVDIFRADEVPNDQRVPGTPDRLIGYFAIITASNGQSFVVNVDDDDYPDFVDPQDPLGTQTPLVIPHQLRDNIASRGLLAEENGKFVCDDSGPDPDSSGVNSGGPRLVGPIQRNVPAGTLAAEKVGGLPSIRQVLCDADDNEEEDRPVPELYFGAPVSVREEVFPDLRALRSDETWSLTWEGSLSLDPVSTSIDGPAVRDAQMFVDGAGMRLVDASRPYCEAGVEPYDIVQLRGCDPAIGDAGCPLGYTCYVHPQSQISGLGSCMLVDEAERLANACKPFLTSLRRYTVGRTKSGELQLLPRKHALVTSPISGCTSDAQCEMLADYQASLPSSANPVDNQTASDPRTWACHVDPDRRPDVDSTNQPLRRCLLTCDTDADCVTGTICQANPAAAPRAGYCMEGVMPPQSCVNAPQRFELRAGDAFTMIGSRSGFLHPNVADATGSCVRDPNANPYLVGRIPLKAPACDPAADPRTGRRTDGTYEPNPCQLTVDESEYQLNYQADSCTLGTPDESLVTRDATAIRIRHRSLTLTLVDPTYQGDLRCHGDRQGTLVDVPIVAPGYQIAFRQTAGLAPKTIAGITPSFPVKVTRGPGQSIWIIDEGDFLSTSISQASTRGRVYRVEAHSLGTINLLE